MSPANTYPCLTVNLPAACEATEPDQYYPTGTRNYARVAPADDYQGAYDRGVHAEDTGVKSVYILNDKEAYGLGVATTTRKAARVPRHRGRGLRGLGSEGVELRGAHEEDPGHSGADAVFLGGLDRRERRPGDQGQGRGARAERRRRQADRARTASRPQATIDEAGAASRGMFMSVAGVPIDALRRSRRRSSSRPCRPGQLGGDGDRPVRGLRRRRRRRSCSTRSRRRTATRADVIADSMFETEVTDGHARRRSTLNENGDPTNAAARSSASRSYVATDKLETEDNFSPEAGDSSPPPAAA